MCSKVLATCKCVSAGHHSFRAENGIAYDQIIVHLDYLSVCPSGPCWQQLFCFSSIQGHQQWPLGGDISTGLLIQSWKGIALASVCLPRKVIVTEWRRAGCSQHIQCVCAQCTSSACVHCLPSSSAPSTGTDVAELKNIRKVCLCWISTDFFSYDYALDNTVKCTFIHHIHCVMCDKKTKDYLRCC